ncbi:MAG: DUF4492 domain-containing protein [Muribaculaceae bacterium]|nr:DUF4492 domain-containing protein [Muribaculaceae bacterium]MDE5713783.1 DUF4492 domain-containing protein [Muribaculaceae bacterium]
MSGYFSSHLRKIWLLYYDGFREMTVGKTLWAIILVKLFLFFVIIKFLFFPNILSRDFDNDRDRADHVRHELLDNPKRFPSHKI